MKKIFTLLLGAALISDIAMGQAAIPNGDFENWSTSDDLVTGLGLGIAAPGSVVQDTDAANVYTGLSSALLTTKAINIPTLGNVTFAGSMTLGKYGFNLTGFQVTLGGVPYTDRPDSIEFAYKYVLPFGAVDNGVVKVNLTAATPHDGTVTVGSATVSLAYSNVYSIAKAKINYSSALYPDTLKIQAQSSTALFMGGADGAQLWLDDMQFVGLDTAFKVYLFPSTTQNKCVGDTIPIRTDEIAGDSYAWYLGGTLLPDTTYKIHTGTAGRYSLVVTHDGGPFYSDTIALVINPLPVVTFAGPEDTVCNNGSTVTLSGGSPAGGTYSGRGVAGGVFTPANGPLGDNTFRYTYTDGNGCRNSATATLLYVAGCTLGVEELQSGALVSVYPNPAFDVIYISGDDRVIGGTASMYDVQGRLISTVSISDRQTAVDLHSMSAGMYTVVISDMHHIALAKAKMTIAR